MSGKERHSTLQALAGMGQAFLIQLTRLSRRY
ncbi:hypothetical protein SAMN04489858_1145 [Paracoccus homiensis]|uniref:Uncharacterized protein n=1 Tax=Paracoccus homiensis TaxID=364199 RepID=A0A1I0I2G8_9RHOB|nr:hypothetical protein SAMN04489858_1145 [Paracoccus homiensis]